MQDIRNNQLVLLLKKVGAFLKASLRGRGEIDCSVLANFFGGGGHHNAAGFKIQGSGYLEKDIQKVTDEAVKHIDSMTANKEKELLEV